MGPTSNVLAACLLSSCVCVIPLRIDNGFNGVEPVLEH